MARTVTRIRIQMRVPSREVPPKCECYVKISSWPLPITTVGNSDYFTRWSEVYAIPNQEAPRVTKRLVNRSAAMVLPMLFIQINGGILSHSSFQKYVTN